MRSSETFQYRKGLSLKRNKGPLPTTRDEPRLDVARAMTIVCRHMFERNVFRKEICCIEEINVTLLGLPAPVYCAPLSRSLCLWRHGSKNGLLRQGSATFFALRTGLKQNFFRGPAFKNHKCSFLLRIFITTQVSYYNFDLMRTLSLFCRNETLPPRNYDTRNMSLTPSLFHGFVFAAAITENPDSHK